MSEATTNQQKHAVPAAIKMKFPPGMFNITKALFLDDRGETHD
jgi:hypothetical protein